jgi:flagellar motor switch protein FliN
MVIQRQFDDPLDDIDPVMEQAFSVNDKEIEEDEQEYDAGGFPNNISLGDQTSTPVSKVQFPDLSSNEMGKKMDMEDVYSNIPVNVSVELGRSKITLKEVYEITEGSIIELERLVGEPLDLVVNGQIIAQGEVVAIDNNYGLRLTNIVAAVRK